MSRRTIIKTEIDWQSALDSKPSQGDRVLLKVEDCGSCMNVVGWWDGVWRVCDVLLESDDEIKESFEQDDVLAYAYVT